MNLSDIAEIKTGLVISRKKAELDPMKTYKMLTLKSFEDDGWINIEALDDFDSSEILSEQYLTQTNDVVIRLSSPNTAVYITEEETEMVIPSLFIAIRVKSNKVIPAFLAIYLNAQNSKKRLNQVATGSALSIIKTSTLKELEIQLPTIEHQKKVVELNKLIQREKQLLNKLMQEKGNMYNAIIDQVIEGGRKNDNCK